MLITTKNPFYQEQNLLEHSQVVASSEIFDPEIEAIKKCRTASLNCFNF